MERITLGLSGIEVSAYCLGTMTWGSQNTEAEGHAQIDAALDAGIDFLDTAEMYPVNPIKVETVGRSEEVIGSWLARTGRRQDVVIATKISGIGAVPRDGRGVTAREIPLAVDASLRRLRTDVIDLYQFHWPQRGGYHFRRNWTFDPTRQSTAEVQDNMAEVAEALAAVARAGKVRAFGLSNETAWGTMRWIDATERAGAPRVASIQNEYSPLYRLADTDLAEVCHHEDVTILSYSPLAAGLLTGKYQNGQVPPKSRMSLVPDLGGRTTDRVFPAIAAFVEIARRHGLDPAVMALAWIRQRPVPTIPIIGATSLEQLSVALSAVDIMLDDAILGEIVEFQRAHPMPF